MAGSRKYSKRCSYVSDEDDSCSTLDAYTSEEDDPKSILSLKKESQGFYKSEEHDYANLRNTQTRVNNEEKPRKRPIKDADDDWRAPQCRKRTRKGTIDVEPRKKKRCESKNALNARMNREKKKAYVNTLETEIDDLREANKDNIRKIANQDSLIRDLKQEVIQLKCLLANNKYLGALVSKLSDVTGLPVTSSLLPDAPRLRSVTLNQTTPLKSSPKTKQVPIGVNHPISHTDAPLNPSLYQPISQTDACFKPSFTAEPMITHESLNDDDYDLSDESLFPSLDDFDPKNFLPFECGDEMNRNVGICVHINQNRLSVEFCPVCNSRAMSH